MVWLGCLIIIVILMVVVVIIVTIGEYIATVTGLPLEIAVLGVIITCFVLLICSRIEKSLSERREEEAKRARREYEESDEGIAAKQGITVAKLRKRREEIQLDEEKKAAERAKWKPTDIVYFRGRKMTRKEMDNINFWEKHHEDMMDDDDDL